MTTTIVRATTIDVDVLAHLSAVTFIDAFGHTCSKEDMQSFVTANYAPDKLLQELQDESDYYFIAYNGSTPAGYIRLKEDYTDYPNIKKCKAIELKRIYILKEFQSLKIGAQFLEFAFNFFSSLGYEAIWLGVWEHNDKAIKFYIKHGFTDTGFTHKFYIGTNESTDKWFIKYFHQ